MATELDLPTVLFLQKTSYIAGAVTLGYLRLSFSGERGVGLLAVSFLILAAGSTLAGYAELHPTLYGVLSLINIACAVLGYCLLKCSLCSRQQAETEIPSLACLRAYAWDPVCRSRHAISFE